MQRPTAGARFLCSSSSASHKEPPRPPAAPAAGTARWRAHFQLDWRCEHLGQGGDHLEGADPRVGSSWSSRGSSTLGADDANWADVNLVGPLCIVWSARRRFAIGNQGLQWDSKPAASRRARKAARVIPFYDGVEPSRQWAEGGWSSRLSQVRWVRM